MRRIGRLWASDARRLIAGALLALVGVVGSSGGVALAHAEVVDVVPAPGSVVPTAPDDVVIAFTEQVSISGGSIELFDDTGASIPVEPSVVDNTVVVALPDDLADGTYLVAWRVVSDDSHPVTGTSSFSVGTASTSTVAVAGVDGGLPNGVGLWRVVAMAAVYAGVLVAIGVAWFARRWRGPSTGADDSDTRGGQVGDSATDDGAIGDVSDGGVGIDDRAVGALDRVVSVACLVGIGGLLAALPARIVTVGGGWSSVTDGSFVADTIRGPIGQAAAMSIFGLVGLWLWHRSPPDTSIKLWSNGIGIVYSLLAVGGFALEGHTRTKDPTSLMVLSDVVHLAAGSVWVGGVVALGFVLRRTRGAARARVVLDVSSAAVWAVVAVSVAGLAMSVMVLPSFNALADTGYGLALLVKVAIVIVLLAIGERNRLVLVPAIERSVTADDPGPADAAVRAMRKSVMAEICVFALLLVATATLVGRSPVIATQDAADAIDAGLGPSAESGGSVVDTNAIPLSSGAGTVVADVTPGLVGANVISLTILDLDGEPLSLVEPPAVELRELVRVIGPLAFVAQDVGGGRWEVPVDIPFPGAWELTVRARTGTFDSGEARTEFVVDT